MRHLFDAPLDRLTAADPGMVRMRQALRTAVSVVLAISVLALLRLPITVIMLGTIVAMMSAMSIKDQTAGAKAITFLLLPVSAAFSITVAAVLEPWPLIGDAAFLVIIFAAVYLRRFVSRGFPVGMVGFMAFFFAVFIHATMTLLPLLMLAVAIALICSALAHFVFVPRRPRLALRRLVTAFRARLGQLVDASAQLVETPERRRQDVLRRRVSRLHESALMIETELADLVDPELFDRWQQDVVEIELAGERVAIAARRVATGEEVDAAVRAGLVDELRELRVLAGRDPRPAMAYSDEQSMSRLRECGRQLDALDNPPHVATLRRTVQELATDLTDARRELESDLPEAIAVENNEPGRHRKPAAPPPPAPTTATSGLRLSTRQAIQATIGAGIAIIGGELLSTQRWYWAVITAFLVFANTTTRGDLLIRGARRTAGTLLGILAGMVAATLVSGHAELIIALIVGCICLGAYVAQLSYGMMTFFMTLMLGLLYSLLGTFTPQLLVLRLEETAIGVLAGAVAAILVLPTRTRTLIRKDIAAVLESLRAFVLSATALLRDAELADLIDESRELDKKLTELNKAAEPMTHVISPYRTQRGELRHLLAVLAICGYHVRDLAANAEPGLLPTDDRLPRTTSRIVDNLHRLIGAVGGDDSDQAPGVRVGDSLSTHVRPRHLADDAAEPADALARRIVASVDHLDELVIALARPLGVEDDTDTEPVDEVHQDTARLLGQVRDGTGAPLAEAALTLVDPRGRQVGYALPADDGRYRMEVPGTGTYLLIASSPGRHPAADLVTVPAGPLTKDVVLDEQRDPWR